MKKAYRKTGSRKEDVVLEEKNERMEEQKERLGER